MRMVGVMDKAMDRPRAENDELREKIHRLKSIIEKKNEMIAYLQPFETFMRKHASIVSCNPDAIKTGVYGEWKDGVAFRGSDFIDDKTMHDLLFADAPEPLPEPRVDVHDLKHVTDQVPVERAREVTFAEKHACPHNDRDGKECDGSKFYPIYKIVDTSKSSKMGGVYYCPYCESYFNIEKSPPSNDDILVDWEGRMNDSKIAITPRTELEKENKVLKAEIAALKERLPTTPRSIYFNDAVTENEKLKAKLADAEKGIKKFTDAVDLMKPSKDNNYTGYFIPKELGRAYKAGMGENRSGVHEEHPATPKTHDRRFLINSEVFHREEADAASVNDIIDAEIPPRNDPNDNVDWGFDPYARSYPTRNDAVAGNDSKPEPENGDEQK